MGIDFDVCVIGLGYVGLPLALFLANKNLRVFGIDKNYDLIMDKIPNKNMPFKEKGCQEILDRVDLKVSMEYKTVEYSKNVIITVGTPIKNEREINLGHIKAVIDEMLPHILHRRRDKLNIILRSTVSPGTTNNLIEYIEFKTHMKCGEDFTMCFCPERLVEGKALEEIESIPNIIGSDDINSHNATEKFFYDLGLECIKAKIIEAELAKCFLNMYRYAKFGIVNYFSVLSEMNSCEIYNVLDIANKGYERGIEGSVGFSEGPCLTKDWRMFNPNMPFGDFFQSISNIHQNFFDIYLFQALEGLSKSSRIGILGYTFKRDSDDIRNSSIPKIVRQIEGKLFNNIMINDYNITQDGLEPEHRKYWTEQDMIIENSELLIIAMNHQKYEFITYKSPYILDVWNVTKKNEIYQIRS